MLRGREVCETYGSALRRVAVCVLNARKLIWLSKA